MGQEVIESAVWPYWLLIGVLAISTTVLLVKYWQEKKQIDRLKSKAAEYDKVKEERDKYFGIASKLQPAAQMIIQLRNGIVEAADSSKPLKRTVELLKEVVGNSETKVALDSLADSANDAGLALKNMDNVALLQKEIKAFLDEYLQRQEPPVDIPTQRTNRSRFIALAMMTIDVVESIDNPEASPDRQGLNVGLMRGELLPEDVVSRAEQVDELSRSASSPWARALQSAMRTGIDLDKDQLYLLRGKLFRGYHYPLTENNSEE